MAGWALKSGLFVLVAIAGACGKGSKDKGEPEAAVLAVPDFLKSPPDLNPVVPGSRDVVASPDQGAQAGLILLGERPGLGISDSLSGYFEYAPGFARVESDRNVLCNIHENGVPPTEAALMLADALIQVVHTHKSGMSVRFEFA